MNHEPDPDQRYPHALERHVTAFRDGRLLHVVNFHVTPADRAVELEQTLAAYRRSFDPVLPEHLDIWFETGRWPLRRGGFAAVFYDSHREHLLAAEVCAALGIAGWFLPVTGFMDCPVEQQLAYCDERDLWVPDRPHPDGRLALTWDELAGIARDHVIGAHTATHAVPDEVLTAADVERELAVPYRRIAALAGRGPDVLAWRLGLPDDPDHRAFAAARDVGYRYLVGATLVQRIRR